MHNHARSLPLASHKRLLVQAALLAFGASAACTAHSQSFMGNLTHDDDKQSFAFTLPVAGQVILRTWSFAGGVNGAGSTIQPGGFAPVLSLFDASGSQNFLASDKNGTPGKPVSPDPTGNHFAWDAYLNPFLNAGNYLLVLTEDDNVANQPSLGDGFTRDGQGDFTGPVFLGSPGSFILVDQTQRDSHWAVDLSGVANGRQLSTVPEPGVLSVCAGLLASGLILLRRRAYTATSRCDASQ